MIGFPALVIALLVAVLPVHGQSRTSPPSGAVIVRPSNPGPGEFTSVGAAINSLPNDSSARVVFIYPGTYQGQVNISRGGPVAVYGYTSAVKDYSKNQVSLTHAASLGTAGSDDLSGTLRILSNDVKIYNIDVKNTFGIAASNGQAIALSNYGSRVGVYACRLYSYQDTLYSNVGTQVYLKSYIEGAVDYIFGRQGRAYFEGNVLASKGAGCVTASGRQSNDSTIYVFDQNQVVAASDAFSNVTGNVFLGRPWGDYAKVIFKNTYIGSQLNKNVWSAWNTGDPRTDNILFAEYNSTGPGVAGATRPSFATSLSSSQAAGYTISTAVGTDYRNWVDAAYLISG